MNNYVVYHCHSDLSILDSCTKFKDYIDKAKELNQTAIGISEHGNIYSWVAKKMYCEQHNIKYLHSCEIYLTQTLEENIRDNYHTILIAKNYQGIQELNSLIELSTRNDHFYYKPRISFEEFLNISDNIIKISGCLASPLNKFYDKAITKDLKQMYLELCQKYDYYEIQPHNNEEQIIYNKKLYCLAQKFNKPLIVGTDTHSLNKYKAECRVILQKAKKIEFDNESDFDLVYKTYDELVEMLNIQNALPQDVYLTAIQNTNVMAESVEDFKLDLSIKYPILYGSAENDENQFKIHLEKMVKDKISKGVIKADPKYINSIKEEFRVFKKTNMNGFMLLTSEMLCWCRENGIPVGTARGSVAGSVVAYLTDITDVDPIKWGTVFSRFCNEDRAEVGDIDIDFAPSQRDLVYDYIHKRFGENKTAFILSLGTVAEKGTIDDIGRALNIPLEKVANIKTEYEKDPTTTREKYKDLFYYFDGVLNTITSQSMHPAGIVASPINLTENYGAFWNKDKKIICINMDEIHEVGLVKYDILGLKNIEIIKDTCELVGINYPLSHEVNWEDVKVWNDISTSNIGVFQFEGDYAFDLMKKYKPQKIHDLSVINACLRPSGASYRDKLISREVNKNPSAEIDNLLKDNNGFLIFQEDTIKFLQQICGLSGSEADNIRRAIGRKQKDRLDKALPSILEGYCKNSKQPREIAEKEAKTFLDIIEDSSGYQFGYNHATGYSMIGYICAYLRYYHPLEFICAYLNNANTMEDLQLGTKLAQIKNIKIDNIRFGKSKDKYNIDKTTNIIYKGVGSIKYLNDKCALELYNLYPSCQKMNFPKVLAEIISKTTVNSKQLEILIKLNYFKEYGSTQKLLNHVQYHNEYYGKKQLKKDGQYSHSIDFLAEYCGKETPKQYSDFDYERCLQDIWNALPNNEIPLIERLKTEYEYLGYITMCSPKLSGFYFVGEIITRKSGYVIKAIDLSNAQEEKLKIKGTKYFKSNPLKEFCVFKALGIEEDYKWVFNAEIGKCEKSNDKELVLKEWKVNGS